MSTRRTPVPQDDSRSRLRERASCRPVRTAWLAAFATTDGVVALTQRHAVGLVSISQNCSLSRECALCANVCDRRVRGSLPSRADCKGTCDGGCVATARAGMPSAHGTRAHQPRAVAWLCTVSLAQCVAEDRCAVCPVRWRRCSLVSSTWTLQPLLHQCLTGADDPASDSAQA